MRSRPGASKVTINTGSETGCTRPEPATAISKSRKENKYLFRCISKGYFDKTSILEHAISAYSGNR
ncbi:hypothetical protein D770_10245 [Flammeovirgaceae bacterium 311]|nr:hypothetical protein D770_10245 [Flammeovirgaceae bacterium 311]